MTPKGVLVAVNDVSLTLERGRILGLVGESGSGKSALARSVMGMVRRPGRVVKGSVEVAGEDLLALSSEALQRVRGERVSMVFQDPQSALNPAMRVGEQVAEALIIHGEEAKAARKRSVELLRQVGIPDPDRRARDYPHQFSGGMKQRVVIAIGIANDPDVLIADEPTTALDVTIQSQILVLLGRLQQELGVSIVIITHDMGVVAEFCDDVAVMYAGRIVETGDVQSVFERPRHPYTAGLLASMPTSSSSAGSGSPLPVIPGAPPDLAMLGEGCAFAPRCTFVTDVCRREVPALMGSSPDDRHKTACFVAQHGQDVSSPNVSGQRDRVGVAQSPSDRDRAPVQVTGSTGAFLQLNDVCTDVSERRGLFSGAQQPILAVDSVSLSVDIGETLGLVGESGCGKSTLSRTIMGIHRPRSGQILIDGQDVTAMGARELTVVRANVQYVFQDAGAALNPRRTVRQSLQEGLEFRGLSKDTMEDAARDLMSKVGLRADHLDKLPRAFSGGQRQRAGLARALARDPKLLILDEPVSALDMSIQAQVVNLLRDLQLQYGLGFLFIAHDLTLVRHLSDRVAVMYMGRIVEYAPARQLYASPQHPYTVALLSSSPSTMEPGRRRERIVLHGDPPSLTDPPSGCRFRSRCPIGPAFRADRQICVEHEPTLEPQSGSHVACHFPGELPLTEG